MWLIVLALESTRIDEMPARVKLSSFRSDLSLVAFSPFATFEKLIFYDIISANEALVDCLIQTNVGGGGKKIFILKFSLSTLWHSLAPHRRLHHSIPFIRRLV